MMHDNPLFPPHGRRRRHPSLLILHLGQSASYNLTPSNQSPVLVDSSTQRDLVLCLGTSWCGQCNLGQITLDTQHSSSDLGSTDVDKQLLAGGQFLNLGLFLVCGLDSEQSSEQEDYVGRTREGESVKMRWVDSYIPHLVTHRKSPTQHRYRHPCPQPSSHYPTTCLPCTKWGQSMSPHQSDLREQRIASRCPRRKVKQFLS